MNMMGIFVRPENVKQVKHFKSDSNMNVNSIENKDGEENIMDMDVADSSPSEYSNASGSFYTSLFNMKTKSFLYNKVSREWMPIGGGDTLFRWVSSVGKFWITLNNGSSGLDHFVGATTKVDEASVVSN
eukprot:CAMPEP_0204826514 /NCGR_PEP_ID=MMETSP1346-20131115/4191_1 /ASSEMBLY_ACC=CAM_ASM_000771 /TAXON_ID=215587 /ORGANISM="Aplanochytrium stocchinoi, Strain GSBS06" /LENGTH=128 /DNA_ID=CAMNT_0051954577 /DNA_START=57 /DNA_END=440 /DNA_ORIENTATION=+